MARKRVLLLLAVSIFFIIKITLSKNICVENEQAHVDCDVTVKLENLTDMTFHSFTNIYLSKGTHFLRGEVNFVNTSNLNIIGNSAEIKCHSNASAGFNFAFVSTVTIKDLIIKDCGGKYLRSAAITIYYGANIILSDVTVVHSQGAGISCYCIQGNFTLARVTVLNTSKSNKLYYNNCSGGEVNISNSTFAKNNKIRVKEPALKFVSIASNATIVITSSTFSDNKGGNLHICINGSTRRDQVIIKNTYLTGGYSTKGSGLYLLIYESIYDHLGSNNNNMTSKIIVQIDNVTVERNQAKVGAGIYLEQKNNQNLRNSNVILIKNSRFSHNVLFGDRRGGVALHSINYILKSILTQFTPQYKINISECNFTNNGVRNSTPRYEASGNGVIFVNKNAYFGLTNVTVSHNNCTAILVVTSNLVIDGKNELSFNNASSGGGLLLCKNGILYFRANAMLNITGNNATHEGGGICVESQCLQTEPRCFYQLDNNIMTKSMIKDINVYVRKNTAGHAGNNLFGGLVDFCYLIDDDKLYQEGGNASLNLYNQIFNITENTAPNQVSSITSIPQQVCWCNKSTNVVNCSRPIPNEQVYPGQTFKVPVITVGQLFGHVPGTVTAEWIETDEKISLDDAEVSQTIKGLDCTLLSYTPKSNHTNSTFTLQLQAAHTGDISGYFKFPHNKPLNLSVTILGCPYGFFLSSECVCYFKSKVRYVVCNLNVPNSSNIMKKVKARSWIGLYGEKVAFHESCPYDYCTREQIVSIKTSNSSFDGDSQCQHNRTGKLCGQCKHSLSMVLGSSQCKRCPNRYLLLILAFGLAGVVLILSLTLLNLTVAEGTLSGPLFYASIVNYNHALFVTEDTYHDSTLNILKIFIAWLNLDLGFPVCFYHGLNAYQKAWLQFAFPIYIWVLSIAIILLSKRSSIIARMASKNAVKVLATLVLLCYTKFTEAVIRVFAYASLQIIVSSNDTHDSKELWLEDGNVQYWETKHLILFVFATLFGAVSVFLALVLLFIKPLSSVSHLWPFRWVQKWKPFFDAFTGPYTNHGRFWPGLLLLARILLSVLGGINSLETAQIRCIGGISTIVVLFAVSKVVRPGLYCNKFLDALETFFLLNLGILYLVTAYYLQFLTKKNHLIWYKTLLFLALLTCVGIVLHHIWLKIRFHRYARIITNKVKRVVSCMVRKNDRGQNRLLNYPPFISFTEDREPLLADHDE